MRLYRRSAGQGPDALATQAVALRAETDSPSLKAETLLDLAETQLALHHEAECSVAFEQALQLARSKGDRATTARISARLRDIGVPT